MEEVALQLWFAKYTTYVKGRLGLLPGGSIGYLKRRIGYLKKDPHWGGQ